MSAREAAEWWARLHEHPEAAGDEARSAEIVADAARALGARVETGIGGHGVIAHLESGHGPTVVLRAELDAVATDAGARHSCGHDLHGAALLGTLAALRERPWRGTVCAVFQPAEETGAGAAAMIADGLAGRIPEPDVVLAQHVGPMPLGTITFRPGAMGSASEQWRLDLTGPGGHPGFPRPGPGLAAIVAGAAAVIAQAPHTSVGAIRMGAAANAIPSTAELRFDVRAGEASAIRRVVAGLAADLESLAAGPAAGAPGPITMRLVRESAFDPVVNDADAAARVYRAFRENGQEPYLLPDAGGASDDVGLLAAGLGAPLAYWYFGGTDPRRYAAEDLALAARGGVPAHVPVNHAPDFRPAPGALDCGISNLLAASSAWLSPSGAAAGAGERIHSTGDDQARDPSPLAEGKPAWKER